MGTDRGKLGDFLMKKYVEWINTRGSVGTQKEFAIYLGISPQMFNNYLTGKRKTIEDPVIINKLEEKLGEGIKEFVGRYRVEGEDLDIQRLPRSFRERIRRASAEVNAKLRERNLTGEMPEAEQITIEIFERYGLKYTGTDIL